MILPASAFPLVAQPVSGGGGAMPTVVGLTPSGSGAATATYTIDFSTTGRQAGDLLIVVCESENRSYTTPSGWNVLPNTPQSTGTAGAAGAVRLSGFWKWSDGTETTQGFSTSVLHTFAEGIVIRGANPTTPFNISAGSVIGTATTSIVFDAVTTTVNNCLILNLLANDRDLASSANLSSVVNANLANLTLRFDQTVSSGAGGGLAIITGELATAGNSGSTTATNAASNTFAMLTLAIAPA